MIEISISRELADAHPGFMASCAQRGHAVNVFDSAAPEARPHEMTGVATDLDRGDDVGVSPAIDRRAATSQPA